MTNYEKYKKVEKIIRRFEYAIWGIIVWALSIMFEGGLTINVPLMALMMSALCAIPAIVLDGVITEPIASHYMKKDFGDDEA